METNPGKKKSKPRKHLVGVRVPMDLYTQIQRMAKQENRTVSNYLINLIDLDLKARARAEEAASLKAAEDPPGYHAPPKKDNGGGQGKLTA